MKDINKCEIFEFKNKKYNLKVGLDENSNLLKVTMINIKTNEEILININGLIPQGATPDYVLLNGKIDKEIIEKFKELKLLSNHTGIFAKFNLENMYKYDREGVIEVLKYHSHLVEYEDIGKTEEEVRTNIRDYTDELLKSNEVTKYLENINRDSNKYIFMYSLVDKKNPQNSVIVYSEENGDYIYLVSPYEKGIENKFEIIPEWKFNFYGGMMNFLTYDFEIIQIEDYAHCSIWEEMYSRYLNKDNKEYDKGVQKYLKYCKKNKITKKYIKKLCNLEHFKEDMMKFYKVKGEKGR